MTRININKVGEYVEVQGKRDQIVTGKEKVNGNKVNTETIVCDLNHDNKQLAEKLQYDFSNYLKLAYPNSNVELVTGSNGAPGATYQVIDSDFHLLPTKRQRKGQDKATFTFLSAECVGENESKLTFKTCWGDLLNHTTTFQLLKTGPNSTTLVLTNRFNKDRSAGNVAGSCGIKFLKLALLGWVEILCSCKRAQDNQARTRHLINGIHAFFATPEYDGKAIEPELVHPEFVQIKAE